MKKFLKTATLFCFLGLLSSCGDEDQVHYADDNGFALAGLTTNSGNLPLFEDPTRTRVYEVEVGVTNKVGYDRVIDIEIVDELTTATDAMYDIDEATLIIPANSYVGKIKVTAVYDAFTPLVKEQLVFDIVSVQDQNRLDPLRSRFFLTMFQACDVVMEDFYGTYTAVEDGTYIYDVEVTPGEQPFELILSNIYDLDPESKTHIFLTEDVANPVVTYPTPLFNGSNADVAANFLVPTYSGYSPVYLNGVGGSFDSCEKTITISFNLRVPQGQFALSTVVMTKN